MPVRWEITAATLAAILYTCIDTLQAVLGSTTRTAIAEVGRDGGRDELSRAISGGCAASSRILACALMQDLVATMGFLAWLWKLVS